jgi:hypothetical protein
MGRARSKFGVRVLVGKLERNILLGIQKTWVYNIKMGLGWCGMDWIVLAQARYHWRALVNTAVNLRGSIKCLEIWKFTTGGLSRGAELQGVNWFLSGAKPTQMSP